MNARAREKYMAWGVRAAVVAAGLSCAACAFVGQRVSMNYAPAKSGIPVSRKTAFAVQTFLDKRESKGSVGSARLGVGVNWPLRPRTKVTTWVAKALQTDMEAAGYRIDPKSQWKLGGAVYEANCVPGKRPVCFVRVELWLLAKDGLTAIKRMYKGEGARPQLMPDEDVYASSLEDALRDTLSGFRREIEMSLP